MYPVKNKEITTSENFDGLLFFYNISLNQRKVSKRDV